MRRTLVVALTALAALALGAPGAPAAAVGPIHPGVRTYTSVGQCTANFVFSDGNDLYLGQAAHCSANGADAAVNGCDPAADPLPLGAPVDIEGSDGVTYHGTLAYSSWNIMLGNGEKDPAICDNNDFALVRIAPGDRGRVSTSLPTWGGPNGLRTTKTTAGEAVYTYGSSDLRMGLLSAKQGTSQGTSGGAWRHTIFTANPGIPGDSGSPVLDHDGKALGVLVTVNIFPNPGTNSVSDLNHLIWYLHSHTLLGLVNLQMGTQPFTA